MSGEYDHLLKLVLVGDASVGKSSLLLRFVDGSFDVDLPATIGVDFKVRERIARPRLTSRQPALETDAINQPVCLLQLRNRS